MTRKHVTKRLIYNNLQSCSKLPWIVFPRSMFWTCHILALVFVLFTWRAVHGKRHVVQSFWLFIVLSQYPGFFCYLAYVMSNFFCILCFSVINCPSVSLAQFYAGLNCLDFNVLTLGTGRTVVFADDCLPRLQEEYPDLNASDLTEPSFLIIGRQLSVNRSSCAVNS